MSRYTQAKFDELVEKHRPKGWRVRIVKGKIPCDDQDDPAGLCHFGKKTIFVHPVVDIKSLQVYLHEAAHAHLHQEQGKHRIVMEHEAEMWSFAALVNCKIPVTQQMIRDAKNNLLVHIKEDDTWTAIKWALDL